MPIQFFFFSVEIVFLDGSVMCSLLEVSGEAGG